MTLEQASRILTHLDSFEIGLVAIVGLLSLILGMKIGKAIFG